MSRAAFLEALAERASTGARTLLTAPIGAGKTHSLASLRSRIERKGTPVVFVDLFTAASTPEHLLAALTSAVRPFLRDRTNELSAIESDGAMDRHHSSGALLRFFDLLAGKPAPTPFAWLIDEITEIRSLAYFPELADVEKPFSRALENSHAMVATSSYPALARELFPAIDAHDLPGLTTPEIETPNTFRAEREALADALALTRGFAATLLPLIARVHETRDATDSLAELLGPGRSLELVCRRHYEVMLLRSRGYAVSKRAAEVVAGGEGQRLTDLFPLIGRTAGASRQYLRWLVEVGLLDQVRKRYHFADPVLGIWAALYLGRPDHPSEAEILDTVKSHLAQALAPEEEVAVDHEPDAEPMEGATTAVKKRVDRFEEID
jgi:hypothetical protein